jgi:hypothetical protein
MFSSTFLHPHHAEYGRVSADGVELGGDDSARIRGSDQFPVYEGIGNPWTAVASDQDLDGSVEVGSN